MEDSQIIDFIKSNRLDAQDKFDQNGKDSPFTYGMKHVLNNLEAALDPKPECHQCRLYEKSLNDLGNRTMDLSQTVTTLHAEIKSLKEIEPDVMTHINIRTIKELRAQVAEYSAMNTKLEAKSKPVIVLKTLSSPIEVNPIGMTQCVIINWPSRNPVHLTWQGLEKLRISLEVSK